MDTLFDITPVHRALITKATQAITECLAVAVPEQKNLLLPIADDLYRLPERQGMVYRLTEGTVTLGVDGEGLFIFEAGDLVGFEHCGALPGARHAVEFAVRADAYRWDALLDRIAAEKLLQKWCGAMLMKMSVLESVLSQFRRGEKQYTPDLRSYQKGDTIIVEGTRGSEVFTLMHGTADVLVRGVKVGEILRDEIFGAIAALTNTPRTATVRASSDAMVLSLPGEKFLDLMLKRPITVLKLIQDMARSIVSLNERVVELSKGEAHLPKGF